MSHRLNQYHPIGIANNVLTSTSEVKYGSSNRTLIPETMHMRHHIMAEFTLVLRGEFKLFVRNPLIDNGC